MLFSLSSSARVLVFCSLLLGLLACDDTSSAGAPTTSIDSSSTAAHCDPDNGSITLPDGFCAAVVANNLGTARHLAVRGNGDIYVKLRETEDGGGIVALRDTNNDYKADVTKRFGDYGGTGIALHNGYLYASSTTAVYRYPLAEGALMPEGGRQQTVVSGFPQQGQHTAKSIAIGGGHLYVNVGAPANACQEQGRTPGSPGKDPCPLLKKHGGIWQFVADETGQAQSGGARFATGLRNAVALAWSPAHQALFLVQHGRDQLRSLWPDLYTQTQSAKLPAEEFFRVNQGDNFGWPYCYYDQIEDKKVLAPEYGGDGSKVGRCSQYEKPLVAFPGHWAPNGLHFYTGSQFPERYRKGAFVAFHGSWNRAPKPQAGYHVSYVPFEGGQPTGEYEMFADGFAGTENLESPGEAEFRPMGLAQGPRGALYLSDSVQGRIWRITSSASEK